MAEPYRDVMDFAFFAVNFHYSRADYNALTATEKAFIYRAWEDKTVSDSTLIRNAVLNAVTNAFRKKGKKMKKLWHKIQRRADQDKARDDLKIVMEIEKKEGKSWVDQVYKAAGFKKKGGK